MELFDNQPSLLIFAYVVVVLFAAWSFCRFVLDALAFLNLRHHAHRSTPISENSQVGDFVQFSGHVAFPNQEHTPFERVSCSYWTSRVWAIFTTKKKKPDKGLTTHSPTIYTASSINKPLVISNKQQVVNVNVAQFSSVVVNPKTALKEYAMPPSSEIEKLAKPKYQRYRVMEMWLPEQASVFVVGVIQAISQHSFHIGTLNTMPLFLFLGSEGEYKSHFLRRCLKVCMFSCLPLLAGIISTQFMLGDANEVVTAVAVGLSLASLFIVESLR